MANKILTDALAKLSDQAVKDCKGQKERAMAPAVAQWMRGFCEQSCAFSRAVIDGGSLSDCLTAVAKDTGNSISDLDAMKKAVKFYFPDGDVHMDLRIELPGEETAEAPTLRLLPKEEPTGPVSLVLNLEDFF